MAMISAAATMALAYAGIVLALYLGQERLIYLPDVPSREVVGSPRDIGLDYERVAFAAEDGVRLEGWYIPARDARATLLFLHGNAGNISHRLDSLRIFNALGLNVLIFDYRGYGRSDGRPSEAGLNQDALAAWRHLVSVRGEDPGRIVLFGRSLGAAVAARLAARLGADERPAALILESAFTSVPDLAADLYWWLPARRLTRLSHATGDYVANVFCPVLVIHSPEDEIIPFRHGQAVFEKAPSVKTFLTLRGDHNSGFLRSEPQYSAALRDFLSAHLPSR